MDKEVIKNGILKAERDFSKMASEKGIPEAFYFFAGENAVIKRENDTLIRGKEGIRSYYLKKDFSRATLEWEPDFIDVSDDGTIGYTYGKFRWTNVKKDGDTIKISGVFHTVWKKQKDGTWKYVWD